MFEKQQLRKAIRGLRDNAWTAEACMEIQQKVMHSKEFQNAKCVLLYYEIGKEVAMSGLLYATMALDRKMTAIPIVTIEKKLEIYLVQKSTDIVPCVYDKHVLMLPDPKCCRRMSIHEIDLAIVPGVAFDENCNRLGYGTGFYDRLLQSFQGIKIGVALEAQIVRNLPAEDHDVPMDYVITDKRILTR